MHIRDERPEDADTIFNITEVAFRDMPHSDGDEQHLVNALRADGALTLSLVAELEGAAVGHIAFSAVTINGDAGHWYGLGPVSVLPELHNQGIGSALIREGLTRLEALGAEGCVLLGHADYYPRFGFVADPELTYGDRVTPNFMRLVIKGDAPKGKVAYHPAFEGA
jgi:putative acetyltransferase